MYYKGFDFDAFCDWLCENFELDRFRDKYALSLIESIVNFAHKWEHVAKDQFAEFIADMLPEVTLLDVAQFCEDGILTDNTLAALGRTKKGASNVRK